MDIEWNWKKKHKENQRNQERKENPTQPARGWAGRDPNNLTIDFTPSGQPSDAIGPFLVAANPKKSEPVAQPHGPTPRTTSPKLERRLETAHNRSSS